jgi:hypothetical protein
MFVESERCARATAWAEELQNLAETDAYFFCLNRFLFMAAKR